MYGLPSTSEAQPVLDSVFRLLDGYTDRDRERQLREARVGKTSTLALAPRLASPRHCQVISPRADEPRQPNGGRLSGALDHGFKVLVG